MGGKSVRKADKSFGDLTESRSSLKVDALPPRPLDLHLYNIYYSLYYILYSEWSCRVECTLSIALLSFKMSGFDI